MVSVVNYESVTEENKAVPAVDGWGGAVFEVHLRSIRAGAVTSKKKKQEKFKCDGPTDRQGGV